MRLSNVSEFKVVGGLSARVQEAVVPTDGVDPAFEAFVGAIDLNVFNLTSRKLVAIEGLFCDLNNLQALIESIKTFGLTKSLLSFADHDGTLSSTIPEFPALEDLTQDVSPRYTGPVIAALEAKIGKLVEYIWTTVKSEFRGFFRKNKYHLFRLDAVVNKTDALAKLLEGRTFDKDYASKRQLKAPSFEALISGMEHIAEYTKVLQQFSKMELPVSYGDYHPWVQKLDEMTQSFHPICRYIVVSNGTIAKNPKYVLRQDYKRSSLVSLGYTDLDKFATIRNKFKETVTIIDEFLNDVYNVDKFFKLGNEEHAARSVASEGVTVLFHLYDNIVAMMSWVEQYAAMTMKALFFCADKTSVANEELNFYIPSTRFDQISIDEINLRNIKATISELRGLNESIKTYGLTRSLISFADHTGALSKHISAVPSLENLNFDQSPQRAVNVVAALEGKLLDRIKAFMSAFAHVFTVKYESLEELDSKIQDMVTHVHSDGLVFSISEARNWNDEDVLHYEELLQGLGVVPAAQSVIKQVFNLPLPKNDAQFESWAAQVYHMVQPVRHAFESLPDIHGRVEENHDAYIIFDVEDTDHGSLYVHGYNSGDKLAIIAHEFSKCVASVNTYNTLYEKFESIMGEVTNEHDDRTLHNVSEVLMNFVYADEAMLRWLHEWPARSANAMYDCMIKL